MWIENIHRTFAQYEFINNEIATTVYVVYMQNLQSVNNIYCIIIEHTRLSVPSTFSSFSIAIEFTDTFLIFLQITIFKVFNAIYWYSWTIAQYNATQQHFQYIYLTLGPVSYMVSLLKSIQKSIWKQFVLRNVPFVFPEKHRRIFASLQV